MKIITYNINGIRSAINKGFIEWVSKESPDILCLQEIKADENQFNKELFESLDYNVLLAPAIKKGYSGVALLSKHKQDKAISQIGIEDYDNEGRWLGAVIRDVLFISAYFPSGSSGDERQKFKYQFLNDVLPYSKQLIKEYNQVVISGDFNICHKPIDIHDPIGNKNSSGFLPDEREWLGRFFDSGWTDGFRYEHPEPHNYTWWSYRAGARKKNKGWRIDYQAVSDKLTSKITSCNILSEVVHSDHCPVSLILDI